jgi:hypothetical protein
MVGMVLPSQTSADTHLDQLPSLAQYFRRHVSYFFNVGWGYHVSPPEIRTPSQEEGRLDVKGMEGVRAVGHMAAEILRKAGELIKVSVSGGL